MSLLFARVPINLTYVCRFKLDNTHNYKYLGTLFSRKKGIIVYLF